MTEESAPKAPRKPALASPSIKAYFANRGDARPVLFITGCGRSGTTLTLRCLATVKDKVFYTSETSLVRIFKDDFDTAPATVGKRTHLCHQSFEYIPPSVHILQVVRHPREVMTSRHPDKEGFYHEADRWIAEYTQYEKLKALHPPERLLVMRYEDLLTDPDAEQARIAKAWDFEFDLPFSRYHELSDVFPTFKPLNGERQHWDAIDPERAKANRADIKQEVRARFAELRPQLEPHLSRFCAEFGYSLD